MSYEYVPPGFEMVIHDDVRAWNLWWNLKLSNDPQDWDNEVRLLNRLQKELRDLAPAQRLVRAHIASFCRYDPSFPESIDVLCQEIGQPASFRSVRVGCEGRGLLECLGHPDPERGEESRDRILSKYADALRKWDTQESDPQNVTEVKVFGLLGAATERKQAFVRQLLSAITSSKPSMLAIRQLAARQCRENGCQAVLGGKRPHPFDCVLHCDCVDWSAPVPRCRCCVSMVVDCALLSAGTSGDADDLLHDTYRFYEEYILAYALSINSWLSGTGGEEATWPERTRYLSGKQATGIARKIHVALGTADEAKRWLAGCLLKTITTNSRGSSWTELIDERPDATSWLRRNRPAAK